MKNEHTSALCPACGSDCNERDELEKAEREIERLRATPVAWGQLGMMNGRAYLRQKYDREPYPPPPDVARNLMLVPLYLHPPAAEVQRLRAALECIEKCTTDQLNRVIARRALERV